MRRRQHPRPNWSACRWGSACSAIIRLRASRDQSAGCLRCRRALHTPAGAFESSRRLCIYQTLAGWTGRHGNAIARPFVRAQRSGNNDRDMVFRSAFGPRSSPGRMDWPTAAMPSRSKARSFARSARLRPSVPPAARAGAMMRSMMRLACFLIADLWLRSTLQRPKPRSRLACVSSVTREDTSVLFDGSLVAAQHAAAVQARVQARLCISLHDINLGCLGYLSLCTAACNCGVQVFAPCS